MYGQSLQTRTLSFARGNLGRAAIIAALLVLYLLGNSTAYAAGASISGTVVNVKTGEPLVGVTVMLENTTSGARSNLEGKYTIRGVPEGTYTLVVSSVGYASTRVEQVVVSGKESMIFDVTLEQKVVENQRTVRVTAKAIEGTDAALLRDRQKAVVVSDAISATTISRSGSSDAGDAVKQVTGASVMDGKYVYVRGLGGRYSNTLLNGSPLPSADPDQHAVHMDLLPAKLLDKVVVRKTFTPDQNGNFTGGSVDIGTKSMPEGLTLNFGQSTGYNSRATLKDGFYTYKGGDTDWLAVEDGTRELPDILADPATEIPRYSRSRNDRALAHQLDDVSKAFNNVMSPSTKTGPVNQSYNFSFGNRYMIGERPLGVMATISYSNKASFYDDGLKNRWERPGSAAVLNPYYLFNDIKGTEEVLWGGLAGISFEPGEHHHLGMDVMYNRNAETTARYLYGEFHYEGSEPGKVFETRALKYTERYLRSVQLSGEHYFGKENTIPFRIEWQVSYSENNQNTPDFRTFADFMVLDLEDPTDTAYITQSSGIPVPVRWYGEMQERKRSIKFDLNHDLSSTPGSEGKVKMGIFIEQTRRENRERRLRYTLPSGNSIEYNGNPDDYFSSENVGITDSSFWKTQQVYMIDTIPLGDGMFRYDTTGSYTDSLYRYSFGNVIEYNTQGMRTSNYDGRQSIYATYAMIELSLTRRFQAVYGARLEVTEMRISNVNGDRGDLNNADVLPSVSLIFRATEKINVRLAATRTLARPIFREKIPMQTYEYNYDYRLEGVPETERTLISNYDLRWEYFTRPGEIFAVSGYYKYFDNPITRFIVDVNGLLQPRNVAWGRVYGLEIEFRSRLDRLAGFLGNFTLGGNLSFINSKIKMGDKELQMARSEDPSFSDTRRMQGQSPYIVNLNLDYESRNAGTLISLMYNVFGERLTEVSLASVPDVYEQPFHSLNFNFTQKFLGKLRFGVKATNILDETLRKTQTLEGIEYIQTEYRPGRTVSVGVSYSL